MYEQNKNEDIYMWKTQQQKLESDLAIINICQGYSLIT